MNNNNPQIEQELNEMRQQMGLLKEKLADQELVNKQMMLKVTSQKVSKIGKEWRLSLLIAIIALPFILFMFTEMGLSIPFIIATVVYFLVCVGYSFYTSKGINGEEVLAGNLIETQQRVLRYKRLGQKWLMFIIPVVICWFLWFTYEITENVQGDEGKGVIVGGIVGGILGGIVGGIIYHKNQKKIKKVLEELDELTE